MGGCGSDVLSRLGPEFSKFVAAEKGKVFIDTKVKELKESIFKQSDQVKNQTISSINAQQDTILKKVRQTIIDIDKQKPGTLDKAASLQRKQKESLLGADDIRDKFKQLRLATENQFRSEQQRIANEVQNVADQTKKNLDASRPHIPIYDQLPQGQKKKAFQEGQKKFSSQIKSEQDKIQQQLSSKLNLNNYTQVFKDVQSSVNIDGISKQAQGLIETAKHAVSTTSVFC